MRVLMLSWEFPPRLHGGLGRHVDGLSRALVRAGHAVDVIANSHPDAPVHATVEGVRVHRVAEVQPEPPAGDWLAQVMAFNIGLQSAGHRLLRRRTVDLVHAHDWLVAPAAIPLARDAGLPLVATIHSTELGRHQGYLPGPLNRSIHGFEAWLAAGARRVITCSHAMAQHVTTAFDLPGGAVERIGNGVDVADFAAADADAVQAARAQLGRPQEPLLLFVGRLEYEKGVQDLLRAVRRLRSASLPAQLIIAGEGTYRADLEALRDRLRLRRSVAFAGFCDRRRLTALYHAADVTVVPSIYEPFGIVALEAMAAGTPLVATRTGGLAEVVEDGGTGLLVEPGDVTGIAEALRRLLTDAELGTALVVAAREEVLRHGWDHIAARTADTYRAAVDAGRAPSTDERAHR